MDKIKKLLNTNINIEEVRKICKHTNMNDVPNYTKHIHDFNKNIDNKKNK